MKLLKHMRKYFSRGVVLAALVGYGIIHAESRAQPAQNIEDPLELLAICSEKLAKPLPPTSCFNTPSTPPQSFGNAVYAIWVNRENDATKALHYLNDKNVDRRWSWAARAEAKGYRKSIVSLKRELKSNAETRESDFWRGVYQRLHLHVLFAESDWPALRKELQKYGRNQLLGNLDLAVLQVSVLLMDNNLNERQNFVLDLKSHHPHNEFVLIAESRLALESKDLGAAAQVLESRFEEFKTSPAFLVEYGLLLLEDGSSVQQKRGESLIRSAFAREFNRADFVLSTTLLLLHRRHTALAWEVYSRLESVVGWEVVAHKFTDFHTIRAWQLVYEGDISAAELHLATALNEAPYDAEANWLRYLICKARASRECIAKTLGVLWRVNQRDQYVRKAIFAESKRFPNDRILQSLQRKAQ